MPRAGALGDSDGGRVILAAAGRAVDGRGDLAEVARLSEMLDSRGLRTEQLAIAPLGRAPWNSTTLNAIVAIAERLHDPSEERLAGVHSNGSLGYQQGFVLLERAH